MFAHARSGGDASHASHLGSEDHAITEEGLAAATAAPPSTAATPSTHILVSSHTRNCCLSKNARALVRNVRFQRLFWIFFSVLFLDLGNTQEGGGLMAKPPSRGSARDKGGDISKAA